MPPARGRPAYDETRPDAAPTFKDRHNPYSSAKTARRAEKALANSSKHHPTIQPSASQQQQQHQPQDTPGMAWPAESVATLHAYRTAYRLDTQPAFSTTLSNAVLTVPGIGRQSPSMARRKDRRLLPKDQLALAVRKHFNNLAVSETDVVVDFLYSVKTQDKSFKVRFAPPKQRG